MKQIWLTEKNDNNIGVWYLTNDGDIVETKEEAEITSYAVAEVITHGMFPGSFDEWKKEIIINLENLGVI